MKKLFGILCAFALAFACIGLVACGEPEREGEPSGGEGTEHVHTWGEWTSVKAASLFEDGQEERVCSGDASHKETRTVSALGKTADVFDFFTTYASACEQGEKGFVLNKDTQDNSGASTYFGEEDKNFDWDGTETTISFDLDLTALDEEGDFTIFVLAFNKEADGAYLHVDEIRFGIAKTADGYAANELLGVAYDDDLDYASIVTGAKSFTEEKIAASFEISFDAETNALTYTMTVGGQELSGEKTTADDVVGLRYLWNACLNKDGAELSNLVKV